MQLLPSGVFFTTLGIARINSALHSLIVKNLDLKDRFYECRRYAKKDIGILVNFGGDKIEIKRKFRLYTPKK